MWPVFGKPLNEEEKYKESFWQKDKTLISMDYDVLISGKLSRVAKKTKLVKIYFYYLQGQYLCYKEKPTDKTIKGYIKLGPHIRTERKFFKGKKEVF